MKEGRNINNYLAGAAALATFLVYLAALHNDFVGWDDDHSVVENRPIRSFDTALWSGEICIRKPAITNLPWRTFGRPVIDLG